MVCNGKETSGESGSTVSPYPCRNFLSFHLGIPLEAQISIRSCFISYLIPGFFSPLGLAPNIACIPQLYRLQQMKACYVSSGMAKCCVNLARGLQLQAFCNYYSAFAQPCLIISKDARFKDCLLYWTCFSFTETCVGN